jgi:hypothetical protein
VDSHAWEADLRAIRAGTAPRHELTVRYRTVTPLLANRWEVERDGWLDVFADEGGSRPLVRVPVRNDLELPEGLHRCSVVGWPEPGRSLALADGTVLPLGPAYPLHAPPPKRWLGLAAVALALALSLVAVRYRSAITVSVAGVMAMVALRVGLPLAPWLVGRRHDRR